LTQTRYQLRDDRLRPRFRFQVLRVGAFMLLIALGLTAKSVYERGSLDPIVDLPIFGVIGIILFFVARKQRAAFESAWRAYSLTIDDEGAQAIDFRAARVTISAGRIKSIVERRTGLTVTGSAGQTLSVPRDIENYDEVRARLAEWAPIKASSFPPIVLALATLGLIGAELIVHYSKQRWLILAALLFFLLVWVTAAVAFWRAKKLPNRRVSLIMTILMGVGTIYSLVELLQSRF
jgi:hypothetical protein